jgi:hypothetical protein
VADIYRDTRCMRCGKRHTLYDTSTVWRQDGSTYSYTCPANNQLTQVSWLRFPEVASVVPDAAIPITWVSD